MGRMPDWAHDMLDRQVTEIRHSIDVAIDRSVAEEQAAVRLADLNNTMTHSSPNYYDPFGSRSIALGLFQF